MWRAESNPLKIRRIGGRKVVELNRAVVSGRLWMNVNPQENP